MQKIEDLGDLQDAVAAPYAWPGGYPRVIQTRDGGLVGACCYHHDKETAAALFDRFAAALPSITGREPRGDRWIAAEDQPIAADVLWENEGRETCAECGEVLECSYPPDEGAEVGND